MIGRGAAGSVAILSIALAVSGCGATGAGAAGTGSSPAPAGGAELEALYWERLESARTRYSDADVHFMTGMIGHHTQALVMAGIATDRAIDPSIRTLAARIANGQRDEIAIMRQWLDQRNLPVPDVALSGSPTEVHGGHHGMPAAGMLSPEEIRRLEEVRGAEFDRLFLESMILHHRGAITMVHDLFGTDGAAQDPDVFRLASDIQVDQVTEIARMERMLAAMTPNRAWP